MDNSNTHGPGSFYEAFAPDEAKRLAARFECHYIPKHDSWLNLAEIELSDLSRMCLDQRFPDKDALIREVAAWERERNAKSVTVEWRFTTDDARTNSRSAIQQYPFDRVPGVGPCGVTSAMHPFLNVSRLMGWIRAQGCGYAVS